MKASVGGYGPSEAVSRLWERARHQPAEMFLPGFRRYFYLEGWMNAEGQPLPIRNACALANVIEQMPVLLFDGEIIVGESGDRQWDEDTTALAWLREESIPAYVSKTALSEERKTRMLGWLKEKPFAYQSLAPVSVRPDEVILAEKHGLIQAWGARCLTTAFGATRKCSSWVSPAFGRRSRRSSPAFRSWSPMRVSGGRTLSPSRKYARLPRPWGVATRPPRANRLAVDQPR